MTTPALPPDSATTPLPAATERITARPPSDRAVTADSTSATTGGRRTGRAGRSLGQRWVGGWGDLALVVTNALTSIGALIAWLLVLVALLSIPGFVGLVLIVPALWICGLLGHLERHRVNALTGAGIAAPEPSDGPLWQRLFLDWHNWRSTAYMVLHSLWGMVTGWLTIAVVSQAFILAALPLYAGRIPDEGLAVFGLFRISGFAALATTALLGALTLLITPLIASLVVAVDIKLTTWLLGRDESAVVERLSERVDTLTSTRRATIDSVEAERRRIERDLHDGPQQRLVAIAMSLGMAKEAIDADPASARELIDEAHASAKEAIVEMRHVARGIVPPVLADRGLDAALSALAARTPIRVEVRNHGVGRVDPTVEAIAYFVVSEALTNVTKHAAATAATVDLTVAAPPAGVGEHRLVVTVTDNGRGGADPTLGTGLTGLRQRVGAIDGDLTVSSPVGGPTQLAAALPLRGQVDGPTPSEGTHGPRRTAPPPSGSRPPGLPPNDDLATRYLRPGRSPR